MALITCPECAHQVSTEAEVCPQCGYPIGRTTEKSVGPAGQKCYACAAMATTRCSGCDCFSCAKHLKSCRSGYGYTLLCKSCSERNEISFLLTMLFIVILVSVAVISAVGNRR